MRNLGVILLLLVNLSPIDAQQVDNINSVRKLRRLSGPYISILYISRNAFPMSSIGFTNPSIKETSSSMPSLGFAVGGSLGGNRFYLGADFEFGLSQFSDDRVSDRTVYFFDLNFDIGIHQPSRTIPFALYGLVSVGYLNQSDYDSEPPGPDGFDELHENLEESAETFSFGFGSRLGIWRHLVLELEYRAMKSIHVIVDPIGPGSNYGYLEDEMKGMGSRFSLGMSYLF